MRLAGIAHRCLSREASFRLCSRSYLIGFPGSFSPAMLLKTTREKPNDAGGSAGRKAKNTKNKIAPKIPPPAARKKSAHRARAASGLSDQQGPVASATELRRIAIFLDVDGTLLDIAPRPQEVVVPASLLATLKRLYDGLGGAVAFISGRPLVDIDRIFAPLNFPAVGGHGAEIRPRHGGKIYQRDRSTFDPNLKLALYDITRIGPGIIFEDKGYSVALHYRLAPQLGGALMDAVSNVWGRFGKIPFEILPGKSVIEIKPVGFDKGSGLRALMAYPPFKGRRPIFIGDDVTDHAAFEVLPEFNGIGCSVGGIVPGASFNFDGPDAVRSWLEEMSHHAPARTP